MPEFVPKPFKQPKTLASTTSCFVTIINSLKSYLTTIIFFVNIKKCPRIHFMQLFNLKKKKSQPSVRGIARQPIFQLSLIVYIYQRHQKSAQLKIKQKSVDLPTQRKLTIAL